MEAHGGCKHILTMGTIFMLVCADSTTPTRAETTTDYNIQIHKMAFVCFPSLKITPQSGTVLVLITMFSFLRILILQ